METLEQFSQKEQLFIVSQGIEIYEKHKIFLELKKETIHNSSLHEKELHRTTKEILQEFIQQQSKDNQEHHDQLVQMLKHQVKTYESEIQLQRKQQEQVQIHIQEEIERRTKERTNILQMTNTTLEERMKHIQDQHTTDKERIEELEKRYDLVSKGLEFEKHIYEELVHLNDTYYNNVWDIIHVGQTFGGKGDIILKHKETQITIMIDPKNHDNVNKQHKDKFVKDMRNELNNYKAGIMVSRGKIRGKKNYEEIEDGTRRLIYISNFKLGQEDFLMTMIEQIHNHCIEKQEDTINMEHMKSRYIQEYKNIKKQKDLCETQIAYFRERVKCITGEYHEYFGEDIQLQTSTQTSSTISSSALSSNELSHFVLEYFSSNIKTYKGSNVKVQNIFDVVQEAFPNITNTKFVRLLNQWKKIQPLDNGKKCSLRGMLDDYEFSVCENLFITATPNDILPTNTTTIIDDHLIPGLVSKNIKKGVSKEIHVEI